MTYNVSSGTLSLYTTTADCVVHSLSPFTNSRVGKATSVQVYTTWTSTCPQAI